MVLRRDCVSHTHLAWHKGLVARHLVCWQGPRGTEWPVAEGQLVLNGEQIAGHVTSVGRSATLGRTIGMAFAAPASATPGATITIKGVDGTTDRIVATVTTDGDRTALALDGA